MIGLKRGAVKLLPYNAKWAEEFEKEKKRLFGALGDKVISIQHIGSTSVPGLDAKPIIDLALGIRRFKDAEKLMKPLAQLGYNFDRKFQYQRFLAKGPDTKRTRYLHVMRFNGKKWRNDKLFRDYLRTHPKQAKAYSDPKRNLSKQYPDKRQKYSDGKDKFVKKTLRMASK